MNRILTGRNCLLNYKSLLGLCLNLNFISRSSHDQTRLLFLFLNFHWGLSGSFLKSLEVNTLWRCFVYCLVQCHYVQVWCLHGFWVVSKPMQNIQISLIKLLSEVWSDRRLLWRLDCFSNWLIKQVIFGDQISFLLQLGINLTFFLLISHLKIWIIY